MRALALVLLVACNGTMERYFAEDVVEIVENQPYAATNDPRQKLDLYLPRDTDNFPVVVFIHGGFWIHQSKAFFEPVVGLYHNVGIALAREGIGSAVIDYRLVPSVTFDQQFDDCAHAIAWVEHHIAEHRGDPSSIVIAGHSAGGHISALAAFDDGRLARAGVITTQIRGYAPLSPILDLPQMAASSKEHADIAAEVFGTALVEYSPTTYFKPGIAPMLLVMGERDETFLVDQIPASAGRLGTLGAPVDFHVLAGKTHDDLVLDFDSDHDAVTPVLASFVRWVTNR